MHMGLLAWNASESMLLAPIICASPLVWSRAVGAGLRTPPTVFSPKVEDQSHESNSQNVDHFELNRIRAVS